MAKKKAKKNKPFGATDLQAIRAKLDLRKARQEIKDLKSKPSVNTKELDNVVNQFRRKLKNAHYESANTGRWDNDWLTTNATPYSNINAALKKTIARSRRLVDNCGFAQRAITTIVDNVVADGIRPVPLVKQKNGNPDEIINHDLAVAWDQFNDEWDRTRRSTFYESQRLALGTIGTSGSILTIQVPAGASGNLLPIAYQMREPDRLDAAHDANVKTTGDNKLTAQTVHGIQIDQWDVPTAYWFQGLSDAISAESVKIAFRRQRPEQYIGMPWMAPVLKRMWDVQNLIEDKAIQSRIQAMIALWFENDDGLTDIGDQNDDAYDSFSWGPGAVGRGPSGSKPSILQADDHVKDGYIPLMKIFLREIAVSLGLSYYSLARDIEDMNFAGSRAIIQDERRGYVGTGKWFTKEWCQPHYNDFVKWSAIKGVVRGLTIDRYMRNPHRYNSCFWVHRPFEWVDPLKDVQAMIKLKEAGWMSDEMFLQGRGIGVQDFYEQIAKEKRLKEKIIGPEETVDDEDPNVNNLAVLPGQKLG